MRPTVLCVLFAAATAAPAADWPQWRGPTRDGHAPGPAWPDTLQGNTLTVRWKVQDLGPSYSGPIVAGDRVFTTETVSKDTEVVTAYDRQTGKPLWKRQWPGSITVPFFAAKNGSWIRSTPACDGDTLYVAGIRDLLVALDAATGAVRWRIDFPKDTGSPPPDFGFVCSPLVDDTAVYVQAGAAFVKVDKRTGKILWTTLKDGGGMMGSAFSSPVFATLAGRDQILVQTRDKLAGVDKTDGSVLWKREIPSFRGMNILTPTPVGPDAVFTSTYGGKTQLFKVAGPATADAWSLRYEGNMTSPVVIDGYAYLLGKDKTALCVDLRTGREAWRTDKRFGDYWSLVANRDKILALDNRGILYLLKADPADFRRLDERKIADAETWAHLAVCGDELYVRDLNGLTAWRWAK